MTMNVIWIAKHSETLEEMVIYEHIDKIEKTLWVRPKKLFEENVVIEWIETPRFKYIW